MSQQSEESRKSEEKRSPQGDSPFPATGPRQHEEKALQEINPPPSTGDIYHGGVSWEEKRKALPPEPVSSLDSWLYNERFASERQRFGLPEHSWRQPAQENPVDRAPNWPPKMPLGT